MKTVEIGKIGENKAIDYLRKNRYKIIDRNIHVSHNEIDIIAIDKEYIVFVEVKTRSTESNLQSDFGTPAMAVDFNKTRRTVAAARTYWVTSKYKYLQPRFDVIEVYISKDYSKILKINHFENAFEA